MVEVAIVLMIIGLLLGGILKGQELVNSAKARSLSQEFVAVQSALYGYQDRYKAIPGDHRLAAVADVRATVATTPAGVVGNGRIDGAWDSTVDSDESRLFWQHVRLAGLYSGPATVTDTNYTPQTLFGTRMGISSSMQITSPTTMNGNFNICARDIPGRYAKQLDMQIDDGDTQTGSVRVADPASPGVAQPVISIEDGGKYLLCLAF